MTRTIEVSHWGNIAVEETYHMKHVGAELKVFFFTPWYLVYVRCVHCPNHLSLISFDCYHCCYHIVRYKFEYELQTSYPWYPIATTSCKNVETLPQNKNDLSCFKSLLVTGLWDIILTSLLPPIQSCSSKFWVWFCIASNFDKGWRGITSTRSWTGHLSQNTFQFLKYQRMKVSNLSTLSISPPPWNVNCSPPPPLTLTHL